MKNVLLSAIAAIAMTACDNEAQYSPQLPAITQVGANTFGCKIDGIIIIPQDAKIQGNPGGGLIKGLKFWVYGNEARCIEAVDAQYNRGGIYIRIPNNYSIGEFNFETIEGGFGPTYPNVLYIQATKNGKFYGSIENTGKINIVRNDDDVFSGTFYCKLKSRDNPNDIIEVTEGQFDIKK